MATQPIYMSNWFKLHQRRFYQPKTTNQHPQKTFKKKHEHVSRHMVLIRPLAHV